MDRKENITENNEILKSLLEEARKISSFVDYQMRLNKRLLMGSIIMAILGISVVFIAKHSIQSQITSIESTAQKQWDWWDVERDLRRTQPEEGLKKALVLIEKMPDYYEGHLKLGQIYLVQGKLEQAKYHFTRAYELFPLDEHQRFIEAVQKRIEQEKR